MGNKVVVTRDDVTGAISPTTLLLPGSGPVVGEYIGQLTNSVSTKVQPGNGTLYLSPVVLERPVSIDRLAVNVTDVGSTGSVARLGIYRDGGAGVPTTLLVDGGTVSTETTGERFVSVTQDLTPGRWWFAFAQQGAPVTRAQYTISTAFGQITPAAGLATLNGGRYKTGVTGSFGSPGDSVGALAAMDNASIVRVMARISA